MPGTVLPPPRRRRLTAALFSGGAHLAAIAALLWLHGAPSPPRPKAAEPAIIVSFVPAPPGPAEAAQAGGAPAIAPPPVPEAVAPRLIITAAADTSDLLSESQLAGARGAGEGGGGGCDMAAAVQRALRRDPTVRAAVADAGRLGRASLLWNGDWVRAGGQEGKGLAVVRQAVIWEVAFAPASCRTTPMHGLVLLSLADGRTRFAVGSGDWRWSDLLGLKQVR